MTRRVVVTGLGVVTPLGSDLEEVWRRLLLGEVAVAAPRRFGGARPPTRAVGEVGDDEVERLRREVGDDGTGMDLRTLFGVAAAIRAVRHAGLTVADPARAGAAVASGPGARPPRGPSRAA